MRIEIESPQFNIWQPFKKEIKFHKRDQIFCQQIMQIRKIILGTRWDGSTDRRRLAWISGSQASRLQKRNADAKGSYSPQDRRRLACMRLYSTADERGLISGRL
ncbi:MAG: hypothetical protein LBP59_11550 [Planctomycetaceae bacterium]|jgi:hypothetical protein|nr:hypothetical protein [Planctomycetaceae bacterium]